MEVKMYLSHSRNFEENVVRIENAEHVMVKPKQGFVLVLTKHIVLPLERYNTERLMEKSETEIKNKELNEYAIPNSIIVDFIVDYQNMLDTSVKTIDGPKTIEGVVVSAEAAALSVGDGLYMMYKNKIMGNRLISTLSAISKDQNHENMGTFLAMNTISSFSEYEGIGKPALSRIRDMYKFFSLELSE